MTATRGFPGECRIAETADNREQGDRLKEAACEST
jgi:hypothetical protein